MDGSQQSGTAAETGEGRKKDDDDIQALRRASARADAAFGYVQGAHFVGQLATRVGLVKASDRLFEKPPKDIAAITEPQAGRKR